MNRKEFVKVCGLLGLSLPFQSLLSSCKKEDLGPADFEGKVLVIGAGAGGLSAAYLLRRYGVEVEILEASQGFGGRMKIDRSFADFPIPLGAEWLHTQPSVFQEMLDDPNASVGISTVGYDSQNDTFAEWENGQLSVSPLVDADLKFVDSSWYQLYEDYVLPSIEDATRYGEVVQSVDYSGDEVVVLTQNGSFRADRVIVSVPLKILQRGEISFVPALPQDKAEAIRDTPIWSGFKAFIEFNSKFYDTQIEFPISPASAGQKLYYDASYGQATTRHILGLFTVGQPADQYTGLSDSQLRDSLLSELDAIYNNQATANYVGHISQNWNAEPYIQAGYVSDEADWRSVRELGKSVAGRLYFAGGAYTDGEDWDSVHVAAQSAKVAVEELVRG